MKKKKQVKILCEICNINKATNIHHKDLQHKNNKKENLQKLCVQCHTKIHGNIPRFSQLRHYVDLRRRALNIKVHLQNSIKSLSDAELLVTPDMITGLEYWKTIINDYNKLIKIELDTGNYPLWDKFLKDIEGISYNTAAFLISHIDISKSPNVSSLWRYSGLDPGRMHRKKKMKEKEVREYGNPTLKSEILGVIADSFIIQRTPIYRQEYDNRRKLEISLEQTYGCEVKVPKTNPVKTTISVKTRYEVDDKGITKEINAHADKRAKRYMMKIFMQHYWVKDRELHNLPISQPYVQAKLGHTHIIKPATKSKKKK